ncbi:MAG: hypothetical protein ACJAVV_002333 [Alphaproteobacteria bacterium]|jgi:hypothetical protein
MNILNSLNLKPIAVALVLAGLSSFAVASDWQPEASERLIQLPANIIEKRVEQNFNASPMASRLADIESQMNDKTTRISALQQDLSNATGETRINIKYEMVQQKSDYLDLLQESHTLRKQASMQKQSVYQDILQKYRSKQSKNQNPERVQLQQKQQNALLRMEKVMAQVDQNLMHVGFNETSPYANEYAVNVAKIDQLKQAIAKHKANASPTLNGAEVSSEEYLRQLLLDVSMHDSLLDQEGLMLSYMARIVALDAQELEYQIAYGEDGSASSSASTNGAVAKAATAVDLFL